MSLHGRQYWDGFSDSGRMAPDPFAILAQQFPRRHLCNKGSFLFREFVSDPPSVPAVPAATVKLSSLLRSIKAPWTAFCEHHQPFIPSPPHIPHWAASCFVFLYLVPSCPSFLQRALYLYCPSSYYAVVIYNHLIHLWTFHFTLIELF